MQTHGGDPELLERFGAEVLSKVPHYVEGEGIVNSTPLVDVTSDLAECAGKEYGSKLGLQGVKIYAKLDSKIFGGSVKVRPAVNILEDAIRTGRLRKGKTVFEATSGNFGLALSLLGGLGVQVVALVSRRLQEGVIGQLKQSGVKLIDLDIDVCPAPGLEGEADAIMAKAVASSVRQQLVELGFDPIQFDGVRSEAEMLLARQDAIGLAKVLADAYDGFCTEQYDNELNVEVHRKVTALELEEQLRELGEALREAEVICAFGTGGTATGLSLYSGEVHGRKMVRVVFPKSGQDVAGIRTREKAAGLAFYRPESYLGEHEVDFEATRPLFRFFNARGYDVGESGALALYVAMQMVNFGKRGTLVALVADGASKYSQAMAKPRRDQVNLDVARAEASEYGRVLWTHTMVVPSEAGVAIIAKSLGVDEDKVVVAKTGDVLSLVNGRQASEEFMALLPRDGKRTLLVCMAGNTSLFTAKALAKQGVLAESLNGGIGGLPEARTVPMASLVKMAGLGS